jgi:hypothetical protein
VHRRQHHPSLHQLVRDGQAIDKDYRHLERHFHLDIHNQCRPQAHRLPSAFLFKRLEYVRPLRGVNVLDHCTAQLVLQGKQRHQDSDREKSENWPHDKIIKNIKQVNIIFHTLFEAAPSIASLGSLLLLVIFMYSIIGMRIFGFANVTD